MVACLPPLYLSGEFLRWLLFPQHIFIFKWELDPDTVFHFMESSVLVCGLIFNLLADAQLSEIAFTWTEVKLYFFWLVPPSADTSSLP